MDDGNVKMQHKNKHEAEVPEYEVCDKRCSTIFNLHRHMLEQHNSFNIENEQYECLVGAKPFNYQQNLDTHINITHTGMNEHQCHMCEQKCGTRSNFKRHLIEQHDIYLNLVISFIRKK